MCGDFCAHGIAGKDAQKKGESGDAVQTKQDFRERTEKVAHFPGCAEVKEDGAGGHERKKGREDLCQPDLDAFAGGRKHGSGKTQERIKEKTSTETEKERTFFQNITPNKKPKTFCSKYEKAFGFMFCFTG